MNSQDKNYYKKNYLLLTQFELYEDSEDDNYNCISYSVGLTDRGFWPIKGRDDCWYGINEVTINSFDIFYEHYGFKRCDYLDILYDKNYIKVAIFTKENIPTHASIQIDDNWWESKIGQLGIIKHDIFEIEGDIYGKLSHIYKKKININELLNFTEFITRNQSIVHTIQTKHDQQKLDYQNHQLSE